IEALSVNDPPSFDNAGDPPTIAQNAGPQIIPAWATNMSIGPANEAPQALNFVVTQVGATGGLTFAAPPAVNSTSGDLSYTADNGTNGTATFEVVLVDDGGVANGGNDTSAAA